MQNNIVFQLTSIVLSQAILNYFTIIDYLYPIKTLKSYISFGSK